MSFLSFEAPPRVGGASGNGTARPGAGLAAALVGSTSFKASFLQACKQALGAFKCGNGTSEPQALPRDFAKCHVESKLVRSGSRQHRGHRRARTAPEMPQRLRSANPDSIVARHG